MTVGVGLSLAPREEKKNQQPSRNLFSTKTDENIDNKQRMCTGFPLKPALPSL